MKEKKALVLGLLVVLVVGGVIWWRGREEEVREEVKEEEVVMMEEGMKRKTEEGEEVVSREEEEKLRQKIKTAVEEGKGERVELKGVRGWGKGEVWRMRDEEGFYLKLSVEGMQGVEKGYFYEGWLVKPEGEEISVGRVAVEGERGELYYFSKADRSDYRQVRVTLEAEDGNPEPGEVVLEGEF